MRRKTLLFPSRTGGPPGFPGPEGPFIPLPKHAKMGKSHGITVILTLGGGAAAHHIIEHRASGL